MEVSTNNTPYHLDTGDMIAGMYTEDYKIEQTRELKKWAFRW